MKVTNNNEIADLSEKKFFDINKVRSDFPFFEKHKNLIYFDNAATSQRPKCVIDAMNEYDFFHNANPYRGIYDLSVDATERYENARKQVASFIGAASTQEIIFTRNTTESINLLSHSLGEICVNEGDEIIISIVEHHSNMLPWRALAKRKSARIKYLECSDEGEFLIDDYKKLLSDKTKIVALSGMSNVFGRVTDIKKFIELAHEHGAYFVLDAAQSALHTINDVKANDIDFMCFSGHKMLGPMGIGVLYGKEEILDRMPPFLYGGEMIEYVSMQDVSFAALPNKFEAGTVNVSGAVGLAKAIEYINDLGQENIIEAEKNLSDYAFAEITKVPHIQIIGGKKAEEHRGIISFSIDNVHSHDVAAICASEGIAIRAGHHCTAPLHQHLGLNSSNRISLMFYNTKEEVDRCMEVLARVRRLMGYND